MPSLLADRHIYRLEDMLPDGADLELYEPADGIPPNVGDFDGLFVRTVTRVDAETLPSPGRLRWVGTASAGTDHLDAEYLASLGIRVASSAGCNARAVAEYVATMMLWTAWKRGWNPQEQRVGIVGVGHVGSQVHRMLSGLAVGTVCYDPPRALRDPSFVSAGLDELLEADILTLHLPRVYAGPWRTMGWLDAGRLRSRKRTMVIQASRGGIADEAALLDALRDGAVADAVVDVWTDEPSFHLGLLERAVVATPHIAGYSEQAKVAATRIALDDWLQSVGLPSAVADATPLSGTEPVAISDPSPEPSVLPSLLRGDIFPLPAELLEAFFWYDRDLRSAAGFSAEDERRRRFRDLRTVTPYRTEYPSLDPTPQSSGEWPLLRLLSH